MTKGNKSRLAELKARDNKLLAEMGKSYDNIAALERLTLKEEKYINSLLSERKSYEGEMLQLQGQFDYENDTNAENSINHTLNNNP